MCHPSRCFTAYAETDILHLKSQIVRLKLCYWTSAVPFQLLNFKAATTSVRRTALLPSPELSAAYLSSLHLKYVIVQARFSVFPGQDPPDDTLHYTAFRQYARWM